MSNVKCQRLKILFTLPLLLSVFGIQLATCYADADIASVEKLFLEGRYEKVISESDKLIDSNSRQRDELYYLKGLSQLKTDRFNEAKKSFEYILSRFPRSKRIFDAYLGIGDSYFLGGNKDMAIKIYSEMADKFQNDRNIGLVHYKMADCYRALGLNDKAKDFFSRAKSTSPLSFESKIVRGSDVENIAPRQVSNIKPREIPRSETKEYISVQVGCFKSKRNAEKLSQKLLKDFYESYVETPSGTGDNLYRVKVGRFKSKEEAEGLASKLKKTGYSTKICTNNICD